KLRGVGPSGMAVSRDGSRLYVAESGINAVGVIDTKSGTVLGHIPTSWYPYRLALADNGRSLLCICFRGFGNGPNGGKEVPSSPYLGMKGSFHAILIPTGTELKRMTVNVLANNGIVDKSRDRQDLSSPIVPTSPGKASEQIKYVVFI